MLKNEKKIFSKKIIRRVIVDNLKIGLQEELLMCKSIFRFRISYGNQ